MAEEAAHVGGVKLSSRLLFTPSYILAHSATHWKVVAVLSVLCGLLVLYGCYVPWLGSFYRDAPEGYWARFLPIAQFSAAASIAYLALEMFRQANHVATIVDGFFGSSGEDQRGFRVSVGTLGQDAIRKLPDIRSATALYDLCQVRRAALVTGKANGPCASEISGAPESLKAAVAEAKACSWFQNGAGKSFLLVFHPGTDVLAVGLGLAISLTIHVLSTAEVVGNLQLPSFFLSWYFQQTFMALVIVSGAGLPLFYVLSGRWVREELSRLIARAEREKEQVIKSLSDLDKKRVSGQA